VLFNLVASCSSWMASVNGRCDIIYMLWEQMASGQGNQGVVTRRRETYIFILEKEGQREEQKNGFSYIICKQIILLHIQLGFMASSATTLGTAQNLG